MWTEEDGKPDTMTDDFGGDGGEGGFVGDVTAIFKKYGLYIGAGVGALVIVVLGVVGVKKLLGGRGGGGTKNYGRNAAPHAPRRASKRPVGNVNFGAAASKGTTKHHGLAPVYGKEFQMV
jgi:hypothetical protein